MESWRRGRRFLGVLSIRLNGSVCQRVTAPLRFAALEKVSIDDYSTCEQIALPETSSMR
jgi:hypothetical protein